MNGRINIDVPEGKLVVIEMNAISDESVEIEKMDDEKVDNNIGFPWITWAQF